MSRVSKREESRSTFRFMGNWVDLLIWERWGRGLENRFDGENQVPHSEQCLWAMRVETLHREQEVQDGLGGDAGPVIHQQIDDITGGRHAG